jgi:acyl-coenzyme A thioesterase PaaI-like protein
METTMTIPQDDQVPAGFSPHFRQSPLTNPWEPLFSKIGEASVTIALRARSAHCNGKGFLHGGLISSLADNAMGLSVVESLKGQGIDRARRGATVSLAVDFLASAQIGQWVEFVPRVLKVGGSLGFADCLVLADGRPIARGNATFRFYRTDHIGE